MYSLFLKQPNHWVEKINWFKIINKITSTITVLKHMLFGACRYATAAAQRCPVNRGSMCCSAKRTMKTKQTCVVKTPSLPWNYSYLLHQWNETCMNYWLITHAFGHINVFIIVLLFCNFFCKILYLLYSCYFEFFLQNIIFIIFLLFCNFFCKISISYRL